MTRTDPNPGTDPNPKPGTDPSTGTGPATAPGASGARRPGGPAIALLIDAALVLLFAAIGRGSHGESVLGGLAGTAWPFLLGLLVGWLAVLALGSAGRRHVDPWRLVPAGLLIWAGVLVVGMLARVVAGQGTAPSFIVVAAVVLAVFLLGWRALARLVVRRRDRAVG